MAIPKVIHQTAADRDALHPLFAENIRFLKDLNPDWRHKFYDDRQVRRFISNHYPSDVLNTYDRINPTYGSARADLFRYLLMYERGGVYLDIKSRIDKPLSSLVRADDAYLLSYWSNQRGQQYEGWGMHPELPDRGELQQWHIICAPRHPFLRAVIDAVVKNIHTYDPNIGGHGYRVLNITGPIPYTLQILRLIAQHPHRFIDNDSAGLRYSVLTNSGTDPPAHRAIFKNHYLSLTAPIVLGEKQ